MNLKLAEPQDAAGVLKLYDSLRDAPGCTWDEDYPAMREIEIDIQNGDLFIDADECGVRAAISICVDEELEAMNVWSESTMPAGSFMRVAVRADVIENLFHNRMSFYRLQISRSSPMNRCASASASAIDRASV